MGKILPQNLVFCSPRLMNSKSANEDTSIYSLVGISHKIANIHRSLPIFGLPANLQDLSLPLSKSEPTKQTTGIPSSSASDSHPVASVIQKPAERHFYSSFKMKSLQLRLYKKMSKLSSPSYKRLCLLLLCYQNCP